MAPIEEQETTWHQLGNKECMTEVKGIMIFANILLCC